MKRPDLFIWAITLGYLALLALAAAIALCGFGL